MTDNRSSAGSVESILRRALDNIEVEDGKCRWADVANILPYVRGELRDAAQPTQEPIAWKIANTKPGHVGAITSDKEVAETWMSAGVTVDPLYAAQPPAAPVEKADWCEVGADGWLTLKHSSAGSAKGLSEPLQCLRCGTIDAFGPISKKDAPNG